MMKMLHGRIVRVLSLAFLFVVVVVAGRVGFAHEMSGANVNLHAGTLSGGGAVDPAIAASEYLDATIGQASPLGELTGAGGITLRSGFWQAVPEPDAFPLALTALAVLLALAEARRARTTRALPAAGISQRQHSQLHLRRKE